MTKKEYDSIYRKLNRDKETARVQKFRQKQKESK